MRAAVENALARGRYRFSAHCLDRMKERSIIRPEILHVLGNGRHEKSKDVFKEEYRAWAYAIRGKTLDKDRDLRIVVAFDENLMLVVTAIEIS